MKKKELKKKLKKMKLKHYENYTISFKLKCKKRKKIKRKKIWY